MKPVGITPQKALFNIKQVLFTAAWVAVMVSLTACNLGSYYVSALDLTATAMYATALSESSTQVFPTSTAVPTTQPTPEPTATQVTIPTETSTEIPIPILESSQLATATPDKQERESILYYTQSGDTLAIVAARFGVAVEKIKTQANISPTGLIQPQTLLVIPDYYGFNIAIDPVMPDSEVIYSPSALDFDVAEYINSAGGYLSTYREYTAGGWLNAAEIISKVAIEESVNPRILLGLLEYQSGMVFGEPKSDIYREYPMGFRLSDRKGLLKQITLSVRILMNGYYGWREGRITEIILADGNQQRIHPKLNAGTAAIEHFFANFCDASNLNAALYGAESFPERYEEMFGSPWIRALTVEPLYSPGLQQPNMELPFFAGKKWAHTGGPHPAWGSHGAWAALDFAPASETSGCTKSYEWVVASAPGLVVRTGNGLVVLDLDGDGYEQTGWVILYLHIASEGKVENGVYLDQDGLIGHPSCEGGSATGTHVHIARKYNGEWVAADGPLPFNLSGWIAQKGEKPYQGKMIRKDAVVIARTYGSSESVITR